MNIEGPGNRYVSAPWLAAIGGSLFALMLVLLHATITLWPKEAPSVQRAAPPVTKEGPKQPAPPSSSTPQRQASAECAQCQSELTAKREPNGSAPIDNGADCIELYGNCFLIWPERRLLLIVLLAGAIGGTLHSIRSWAWYVGQRTLKWSWIAMYGSLPFSGAATAFAFYLVVRGGFFSPRSTADDASTFSFAALAALAGMFSREAIAKLKKIAESVLEPATKGKDSDPAETGQHIEQVTPAELKAGAQPVELTLVGRGFDASTKVFAGTEALSTTFDSATKQLRATVPANLLVTGTTLAVTTGNTAPAESNRVDVPVRSN